MKNNYKRKYFYTFVSIILFYTNFLSGYFVQSYVFEEDNLVQDQKEVDNESKQASRNVEGLSRQSLQSSLNPWNRHSHKRSPQLELFQILQAKRAFSGEGSPQVFERCTGAKRREINNSNKELVCGRPHFKTIKLHSGPNFDLNSSVARVKRCDGHCRHSRSCKPSKITIKRITVFGIDRTKTEPIQRCLDYDIEEHEECTCGCTIERHHCTHNHVYNEEECSCSCKNYEDKSQCVEIKNVRHWDHENCKCVCEHRNCLPPTVWIPSLCRCAKIINDESENML